MNKINKTILIAHNFSEDSISYMSYQFAHHLSKTGIKVIFISHKPYLNDIVEFNNGKLIVQSWSSKKRPTGLKDFYHYYKIHKKYKPDIIISHFVGANISSIVSKILSLWKTKVFVYYHTILEAILLDTSETIYKNYFSILRKRLLYIFFVDKVVCPSIYAQRDLLKFFKIKKSVVVLNSIDDKYENNVDTIFKKIIFLGRIDNTKGIIEFVKTFKKFILKNNNTKLQLDIAGGGKNVDLLNELIKDCNSIFYKGKLEYSEVAKYIGYGSYVVIPSYFDNLPTVGLEGLMLGKPLLISNNTGLTEFLTDGVDAIKYEVNEKEIFQMLSKIDQISIEQYNDMSKNARNTYLNNFSIDHYFKKMENVIFDK
jgi:glycosyltransferase involved in cell wall biosynthesis